MNQRPKIAKQDEGDRLSSLPDDILHQILSFLGTRQAVQTSVLSKRWRHVWTTTSSLTFDWYDQLFPYTHSGIIKFMEHVLSNRNHETPVSCFKLFAVYPFPPNFLRRLIRYPIDHNVVEVDIDLEFHRYQPFNLSTISSNTTQRLKLRAPLDFGDSSGSDRVKLDVDELENVSIKLWDTNQYNKATWENKIVAYRHFINMLSKLSSAKILTLDSAMIQEFFVEAVFYPEYTPSPFKKLKSNYCQSIASGVVLRRGIMAESEATPIVPSSELLEWPKKDMHMFINVVSRVGDLVRTIKFYTEGFGMKLLRKRDIPKEKNANTFLGFGPEEPQPHAPSRRSILEDWSEDEISDLEENSKRKGKIVVSDEESKSHVYGPTTQDVFRDEAEFLFTSTTEFVVTPHKSYLSYNLHWEVKECELDLDWRSDWEKKLTPKQMDNLQKIHARWACVSMASTMT
ncbi:hypothetical protein AgCh_001677 [Apium graveolens]